MLPVMLSYLQIMYIEFVALGVEDLSIPSHCITFFWILFMEDFKYLIIQYIPFQGLSSNSADKHYQLHYVAE